MQLLDILLAPWAIEPTKLRELQAIYTKHLHGEEIDLAAIEARLGRPLANEQQEYSIQDGGVAILAIEGVIAPKANLFMRISGGASTQLLQKQVESAMVDPRVRSLIIAADSPGGSVFGTPELAKTIFDAAQVKPIVTVSDARMASAMYWIGSAANAVFVSGPTVEVGSIGVVATHSYNPRAAEGTTEITAGKYKRIATGNAPLSAEGREYLQAQVDHVYTVFVNAVAEHRGVSADTVLEHMADGRVFIGQQAIDAGLVDGMSTVDAVAEKLATDPSAFAKRRKAKVAALAGPSAKSQPPKPKQEIPMDATQLKAEHPAVYQAILQEGAAGERARIQAVEASLIPGHEALVASLKFDGKTSGGDAALAVNAAERQIRERQGAAESRDAPKPAAQVPPVTVPTTAAGEDTKAKAEKERVAALPLEERCKALWDANTEGVRADHVDLAGFTAYTRAAEAGRVRQIGRKA